MTSALRNLLERMKDKGQPQPTDLIAAIKDAKTCLHNPFQEATELLQSIASNWELLRRSPEFKVVAEKWIKSETFRQQHVMEKKAYDQNVPARCALDCMLSPKERLALARFQIQNYRLYWQPNANYGPIIVKRHLERLRSNIRDCIGDLFTVQIVSNPGPVLRVAQSWSQTPALFRRQFIGHFDEPDWIKVDLNERAINLLRVANSILRGAPLSGQKRTEVGQFLFELGEYLRNLNQHFYLSGIRDQLYAERHLDKILADIKKSIPYDPTTGHDYNSRRSFLGSMDQWDKYLAWEAHGKNAYRASAEFLPKPLSPATRKKLPGDPSPSEMQRDYASSVRKAVLTIQTWIDRIYPTRHIIPATLRQPKSV